MRPEAKNQFDLAAQAMSVSDEKRDRAWAQMTALGMTPDDPTTIYLVLSGKLEMAVEAMADIPGFVEAAAKRAVGPVAAAAAASLEDRLANQAQHTDSAFKRLMQRFDGQSQKVLIGIEEKVSNLAAERFRSAERRDLMRQYSHIAAAAALVAFLGLAGSAWVFHGMGFASGRAEAVQVAGSLSSLASRPDASTIALLAANNPDFTDAINAWCGTGSANLVTIQEARKCGPFWIDTPPIAGDRPATVAAFWNVANAPLRSVDPLWTLLGGMGLAALAIFAARRWRGQ